MTPSTASVTRLRTDRRIPRVDVRRKLDEAARRGWVEIGRRTLRVDGNPAGIHEEAPGLAVDPTGKRAAVVGRTSVTVVDLADLGSETHSLQVRTSQKTIEGWSRSAQWLDATHVAVYGADFEGLGHNATVMPLQIVELGAWTTQSLDAKVSYAVRMGSALLTAADGITAYEPDGRLRFHAAEGRTAGQLEAGDAYVYAETTGHGTRWVVIDPASGNVVTRRTFARPMNVIPL